MPYEFLGEYLDENGLPVEGAKVIANLRENGDVLGIAFTDSEGNFVIPALEAPQTAYVTVLQDGFIPQIFDNVVSEYYTISFDAPVLDASWNGTAFDLSWTETPNPFITQYIVYRSEDGGPYEVLTAVSVPDPMEYSDSAVNRTLHSYSYKVIASDGLGSVSPDSNVKSFPSYTAVAIALSNSNRIGRSTNLSTFTAIATPGGVVKQMAGIAFSQTRNRIIIVCNTVAGGSRMMYSDDSGLTFVDIAGLTTVAWSSISRNDAQDRWVAVGQRILGVPQIWTADGDGSTGWTLNNTGFATDVDPREVQWVEEFGLWVISGLPDSIFNHNHMHSSATGLSWTTRTANDGGWGHPERITKFNGALYAYGSGSSTIMKTANGTSWTGGNLVFGGKNSVSGLSNGTRAFMCQNTNAVRKTSGGDPLLQANWNVFTDLGFVAEDVWSPPEFGNLVLVSRGSGYRLSSDGGVTFAVEVNWPSGLTSVAKVRSALLTVP